MSVEQIVESSHPNDKSQVDWLSTVRLYTVVYLLPTNNSWFPGSLGTNVVSDSETGTPASFPLER